MKGEGQSGMTQSRSQIPKYAAKQLRANAKESQKYRANASLPKEAWVELDNAVYPTMDEVLRLVNDLRGAGLTTSADVDTKTIEWHKSDENLEATIAMTPETETDEGTHEFELTGVPLPIYQSSFSLGFRDTGSSMQGVDIESMNASAAGRAVAELMEYTALNGWEPTIGGEGYSLYGLTGHPDINTGGLSDWSGSDPTVIREDIRVMANAIKDDEFWPGTSGYWLYLARDLHYHLDDFVNATDRDRTVADHVEGLSEIGRVAPLDYLPDGTALMFRPTRDVVDLAFAADERTVQWEDPFRDYFKVMSIMAPRVKSTMNGECGVAYYTGGHPTDDAHTTNQ